MFLCFFSLFWDTYVCFLLRSGFPCNLSLHLFGRNDLSSLFLFRNGSCSGTSTQIICRARSAYTGSFPSTFLPPLLNRSPSCHHIYSMVMGNMTLGGIRTNDLFPPLLQGKAVANMCVLSCSTFQGLLRVPPHGQVQHFWVPKTFAQSGTAARPVDGLRHPRLVKVFPRGVH